MSETNFSFFPAASRKRRRSPHSHLEILQAQNEYATLPHTPRGDLVQEAY